MTNSKRPAGLQTIHMPLSDCRKCQEFGAGDDPAHGKHFDQRRENIEHRACGDWFLSRRFMSVAHLVAQMRGLFFYMPRVSPRLSIARAA